MNDIHLENCPLCGGEAKIESYRIGPGMYEATIVCSCCGLRLEWSQQFAYAIQLNGEKAYVPIDLSPVQAWNRRVGKNG